MKVLLINPVIREDRVPVHFPAGLGIIAAVTRAAGHDVSVYDQNALRPTPEEFSAALKSLQSVDVVGIGGLITTYQRI